MAKEVEGLRQMLEDNVMKEMVAGLRCEDKGAETEGRVTTTGVNQDREESAGNIRKEEMIAGVEDERERLGQKRGRCYVLGQRLWQPTHTRGTQRAL